MWRSYFVVSAFTRSLRHVPKQDYYDKASIFAAVPNPVYIPSREVPREEIFGKSAGSFPDQRLVIEPHDAKWNKRWHCCPLWLLLHHISAEYWLKLKMRFTAFSFPLLAVGFLITASSYQGVLGNSASPASTIPSSCPKSQCLVSKFSLIQSRFPLRWQLVLSKHVFWNLKVLSFFFKFLICKFVMFK